MPSPPVFLLLLLGFLLSWPPSAAAMRPDRLAQLRKQTVAMFYHGFSNYMEHAFPEDEVGGRRSSHSPVR